MNPSNMRTEAGRFADNCQANDQAHRCRRLAQSINDRETARLLEQMADEYERRGTAID